MSENQSPASDPGPQQPRVLDDRQHAVEFQKTLELWRQLREASTMSIHTLARYEPADAQTEQARAIIAALKAHGRHTARFVASQTGSSESGTVLWWVDSQLADNSSLDNESATRFYVIRLIVDNALLQVEATTDKELDFIKLAIEEARKSVGEDERAHPKVGAVVVKDGAVVATAFRGEMGKGDHAEYIALEKKLPDEALAGATVYATLEPCTTRNHPKIPCAQRLIDRKVRRVVIGMLDPNPRICGKGERLLRDHGIEVERFPHEVVMQLEEMNRAFVRAQSQADVDPPKPPPQGAADPTAGLRDLHRRFVDAQDRFPREVSFVLVMIPHDERQAWKEAYKKFDDFSSGPPRKEGWRCLANAGGGDTPETITIPASERVDGGECPIQYSLESWRCWLLRQSKTAPYPDRALNMFYSLAADACQLIDLRDCGMILDGQRFSGTRGEYQHLLRWAIEQLDSEEGRKWTWLDPPHEHVRTTLRPGRTPRRWMVEMPCVFAAVAHAIERRIRGLGKPWPPV